MHPKYHKKGLLPINLPIPIPSIPIVAPVATHLVSGKKANSSPAPQPQPPVPVPPAPVPVPVPVPAPSPDPQPAPAPTPPTNPPPPSQSPGDGGSSGGGSGGGGSGGGSSGTPGGTGNGDGNGDGSANGGNGPTTGQGGEGTTGNTGNAGGSTDPTGTNTNADGSTTNLSPVNAVAVQPSVDASNQNGGSGTDSNGNGGGQVITSISVDASGFSHTITTIPFATGTNRPNGALGGGTGGGDADGGVNGGGGGEDGGAGGGGGSSHKKGISPAGLGVLIAFLVLAFCVLAIFVLRRRHKARRSARLALWSGLKNQRKSTRSSFADRGDRPDSSFEYVSALSQPEAAHVHETHRLSSGSVESNPEMGNRDSAQYLTLAARDPETAAQLSPISVRPFSPSESWSFPKPPEDKATDAMSVYSSTYQKAAGTPADSVSIYSSTWAKTPLPTPGTEVPPPVPAIPNPFSDPVPEENTSDEAGSSDDPFADQSPLPSLHSATSAPRATSMMVQVIKRPFQPSLPDELAVNRGDLIRLLREFDDGWCQIVTVQDGVPQAEGLIPTACLTEKDGEKLEFTTGKRSSSCGHGPTAV